MIADRDRALSFLKRRSFIKMVEIIDFFPSFGYNRITASNQTTVLCAASDPISGESMRIVFVWIFDRSCTAYNKIPFFKLFPPYMTAARSASALFCCIGIYKLYKKRFYMSHSICARLFLRLLLLALSSLILLSFVSCGIIRINFPGSDSETTSDSAPQDSQKVPSPKPEDIRKEAETLLAALPSTDLGGETVIIATVSASAFKPASSNNEWDNLRLERNKMVADKFNANLIFLEYDIETLYEEALAAKETSTGRYIADFYAIPASWVGRFQKAGLIEDLRTLPNVDLEAPYFHTEAMETVSANGSTYAVMGDFLYNPDSLYGVYYNKDLAEACGLVSPYQAIDEGIWTWDTFFSMASEVQTDVNGNATDAYGHALTGWTDENLESLLLASSGLKLVESGKDQTPVLSDDTDGMQLLADVMRTVLYDSSASAVPQNILSTTPTIGLFCQNKLLFLVDTADKMLQLSDISVNWGFLPLPKVSETQESYSTYASDLAPVLTVPAGCASPEVTGQILQALFAASYSYIEQGYLADRLAYVVRDERSLDSLETIGDTVYYDFSIAFSPAYAGLRSATLDTLHTAAASGVKVSALAERYREAANRELAEEFPPG